MANVLITGVAGFIGFHLAKRLLAQGDEVAGVDNLNDYYDVSLKEARLAQLQEHGKFRFHKMDLADREGLPRVFKDHPMEIVGRADRCLRDGDDQIIALDSGIVPWRPGRHGRHHADAAVGTLQSEVAGKRCARIPLPEHETRPSQQPRVVDDIMPLDVSREEVGRERRVS